MVTGFAAGGLVELVPALAAMLGANVGTTLIVQVFSFDMAPVAPALILIGVLTFRRASDRPRDIGRMLIGLGLMFTALRDLLQIATPYEDAPSLRILLGLVSTQPVLAVVLGAGLAWAAHSSVAITLLVMSFAAKGVVPPDAAFALVLGANLGSAINPCLEGASGVDPAFKRLPFGNLINRAVGVALVLPFLGPIGRVAAVVEPDAARAVADFHTFFNVALAAFAFPLLPAFARVLRWAFPRAIAPADPSRALYLDPAAIETPVVALGGATREALRLADVLEDMLQGLGEALRTGDRRRITETKRLDDLLDTLNRSIKSYLTALDPAALSAADDRRVNAILAFTINMEHAGDVVERNLLGSASKQIKRGTALSPAAHGDLQALVDRLVANVRAAAALFVSGDLRAARLLAAQRDFFRDVEARATVEHIAELRSGSRAMPGDTLDLDLLRDFKRVNKHVVAAAAYPVLEASGELLPSRLRKEADPESNEGWPEAD